MIGMAAGHFDIFYEWWKKLIHPLAIIVGRRVSANYISVGRTLGAIPIVVLAVLFRQTIPAFVLFVICALADAFDGEVARARKELDEKEGTSFHDDEKLGAAMDAVCDKIFFLLLAIGLLPSSNYAPLPAWAKAAFLIACIAIFILETILLAVRLQDYWFEEKIHQLAEKIHEVIDHVERLLKATKFGKLKFLLECVGMGGWIFAQPHLHSWSFYVGLGCFVIAIPFAAKSLLEKLVARHQMA